MQLADTAAADPFGSVGASVREQELRHALRLLWAKSTMPAHASPPTAVRAALPCLVSPHQLLRRRCVQAVLELLMARDSSVRVPERLTRPTMMTSYGEAPEEPRYNIRVRFHCWFRLTDRCLCSDM
jgi:hypothetical protein